MPNNEDAMIDIGNRISKVVSEVVIETGEKYQGLSLTDGVVAVAAGIYAALIGEETNKHNCNIVSTLIAAIIHIHEEEHSKSNRVKDRARFN